MKSKRYFLLAIILLVILGVFLTMGIMNSRRIMLDLIKEEARSFLTIVASAQENTIFAEGRFEDTNIEKLIHVCNYIGSVSFDKSTLEKIRQHFGIHSIVIFNAKTEKKIVTSGSPYKITEDIFTREEMIFFEYFTVAGKKYFRFVYRTESTIFQVEVSAEDIEAFRQDVGINKIMNQISMNPMVKYLVLQDRRGIIFATPNMHTITRIEDDSTLIDAIEHNVETSRITVFNNDNILELIRPFIIDGESFGLFRIGISLDNYYRHVRSTERQLVLLFVVLFGVGFVLFLLFMKYQSYLGLKELFTKTLGAVEDAVLMVDNKGTITGINKMFLIMSAFEEKILLHQDYFSVFKDDPFDIDKVLHDGTKVVDEKKVFNRSIQYATYPLLDEKNHISGVIAVLRDVTKIREFEKEREESERLKFLGNLVANFAHEIKNPLNGLSIATQRLIREFPSNDAEYVRLTTTVRKEIESLNKTLNDFLSLARPRIEEKKEFSLSGLCHDIVDMVREQAKDNEIVLKEGIAEGVQFIGNAENFKRALLNIVLNAIESLLSVTERSRELSVMLTQHKKKIEIKIKDNGEGMNKDEIEKIFTPYFTTKKAGTGLGLYIAHTILKQHSAKIDVESRKGKGTTFKIAMKE